MPDTYYVTPTLLMGDVPYWEETEHITVVNNANEAIGVILAGGIAVLPPDSWQSAFVVLMSLGLDSQTAQDRIHFARTGEIVKR